MGPSKYEQETIILYNEAERTAEIYTWDKRLIKRLAGFAKEFPGTVQRVDANNFILPKRMISIRKPVSEAYRAAARERARRRGCKPPPKSNKYTKNQ